MKQKCKQQSNKRILDFFAEAERWKNSNPVLASQCVHRALKVSTKTKTPIPKELKRRFCKYCDAYFVPGKNYRVRTTGKTITCTCLSCGKWLRAGYKGRK